MTERWRRQLKRLRELRPADQLLERARLGPTSTPPEPGRSSRVVAIVAAFAVFVAGGALAWRAFAPGSTGPAQAWQPGYPNPPASGYYILLPDQADQLVDSNVRVTALTNLPDGTLLDISTTDEGTCCLPVEELEDHLHDAGLGLLRVRRTAPQWDDVRRHGHGQTGLRAVGRARARARCKAAAAARLGPADPRSKLREPFWRPGAGTGRRFEVARVDRHRAVAPAALWGRSDAAVRRP